MSEPHCAMKTSYDRAADTFYVTFSKDTPKRYQEDNEGLVWRFNPAGEPIGVTVQAYGRLWAGRRADLALKIAGPFRVRTEAIFKRLPNAH